MDDRHEGMTGNGAGVTRRAVLAPLMGLAALPLLPAAVRAENLDRPPVFGTARTQFTLLDPPMALPASTLLSDRQGKPAKLVATPGKVMLVNIWATWCEACRTELPVLQQLHEASGKRISIAAISTEKIDMGRINGFLSALKIQSLPVYLDPGEKLASNSTAGTAPLSTFSMPLTYLVTPSGRVTGYIAGAANWLSPDARRLLEYYAAA